MSDSPELPTLNDAILDPATVDQLFFDIAHAAELIDIATKGTVQKHASQQPLSLEQARTLLSERSVFGVQLRYRYRGAEWWDTLIPTSQGTRLVRIEHHL